MFHMEELKEYIITGAEIVDETFMYSKGVNHPARLHHVDVFKGSS